MIFQRYFYRQRMFGRHVTPIAIDVRRCAVPSVILHGSPVVLPAIAGLGDVVKLITCAWLVRAAA